MLTAIFVLCIGAGIVLWTWPMIQDALAHRAERIRDIQAGQDGR